MAALILATQFLLADSLPVANWGMALAGMTMLPLVGVALFLGLPAFSCARKNRQELKPPLDRLNLPDLGEIGERISNSKAMERPQGGSR